MEVGGYRIIAPLGEGGMGRVHLARSASGRPVAVKTVHRHLAAVPEFRERFRRETAAARAVTGVYTAAVLDTGPDDEPPWMAVEFCAGPGLPEAVAAHGPLGSGDLAALGAALAEALAAVHAAGLVHRDVKPSNVLISRHGPKVIDFGIAKSAADESLTADSEAIGSPGFIAPEQLAGDTAGPGPAADVFALGAVLAVTATGRGPFGSGSVPEVLYRTLHEEPDLVGVPGTVWEDFLGLCLARCPADRPTVPQVLAWCAERASDEPWWELEPVAALIRRQEDEVTELLGRVAVEAAGRGPEDGVPAASGDESHPPSHDGDSEPRTRILAAEDKSSPPHPADQSPPAAGDVVADARRDAPALRTSRRRLLAWGGAALAAVGATTTAILLSGDEGGGTARGGSRPEPRPPMGTLVWSRDIGEVEYGGALLRSGKDLYVLDDRGVVRLDAETNTVRWTYPEKDLRSIQARGDLVYVLRDSLLEPELIALRVAGGREVWTSGVLSRNSHRPPRPFDALPAELEGGQGMFTVSDDVTCLFTYAPYTTGWERRTTSDPPWRAYAFDSRTGEELWFHEGRTAEVTAVDEAGGRIAVASSSRDSGVPGTEQYAQDDPLVVLKASDGAVERQIARGARRPQAHPGAEGVGYFASEERIEAMDLATRRILWSRPADTVTDIASRATGGLVLASSSEGIEALDAGTGRKRWSRPGYREIGSGAPLTSDGLALVSGPEPGGSGEGTWGMYALDVRTGDATWAVPIEPASDMSLATAHDGLVHICAGRTLHTVRGPGERRT